jgi:hypothetical protein
MKRSEINKALKRMESVINGLKISLPPFCSFTPEEWLSKGHEFDEIRDNMLGWDITDYGLGDFDKVGFSLITLRNGNLKAADKYPKPYAEKLQQMGARNVLVSMGGQGAVLLSEDGQFEQTEAPAGKLVNSVGAGDSMVAGFLAGYLESGDYHRAFMMGVCSGSASAFSEELASRAEVEELLKQYEQ